MFVFDTSAFINGWRFHYPPETFPSVWDLVGQALEDTRVLSPREVLNELAAKDDDVYRWAKARSECFVEPTAEVQELAGRIQAQLPKPGVRDGADPWVIGEASVRKLTVVTYEGRTVGGAQTLKATTKMPGIYDAFGVPCVTLPMALGALGGAF